jgi:hypothetical protein
VSMLKADVLQIKVFNVLGEEIKMLTSGTVQSGMHRFTYDTSDLKSGLYYYEVKIGNENYVQKLIVTK